MSGFLLLVTAALFILAVSFGLVAVPIGRRAGVPDSVSFSVGCLLGPFGLVPLGVLARRRTPAAVSPPLVEW